MNHGKLLGALSPDSRPLRHFRSTAVAAAVIWASGLFLASCGGDQAEKSAPPLDPSQLTARSTDTTVMQGQFVDSAVSGLFYRTDTLEGFTDHNGYFSYVPGETVSFYIGNIALGSAPGADVVTPIDLSANGGQLDDTAINVLRLLQTLDEDGDPSNGIAITDRTHLVASQFADDTLRVERDSEGFAQSPALLKFIGEVTNVSGLISAEDAVDHFRETQQALALGME